MFSSEASSWTTKSARSAKRPKISKRKGNARRRRCGTGPCRRWRSAWPLHWSVSKWRPACPPRAFRARGAAEQPGEQEEGRRRGRKSGEGWLGGAARSLPIVGYSLTRLGPEFNTQGPAVNPRQTYTLIPIFLTWPRFPAKPPREWQPVATHAAGCHSGLRCLLREARKALHFGPRRVGRRLAIAAASRRDARRGCGNTNPLEERIHRVSQNPTSASCFAGTVLARSVGAGRSGATLQTRLPHFRLGHAAAQPPRHPARRLPGQCHLHHPGSPAEPGTTRRSWPSTRSRRTMPPAFRTPP